MSAAIPGHTKFVVLVSTTILGSMRIRGEVVNAEDFVGANVQTLVDMNMLGYLPWGTDLCEVDGRQFINDDDVIADYEEVVARHAAAAAEAESQLVAEGEGSSDEQVGPIGYDNLKKAELLEIIRERGLDERGTNHDLIERLTEWDAAHADSNEGVSESV